MRATLPRSSVATTQMHTLALFFKMLKLLVQGCSRCGSAIVPVNVAVLDIYLS
jgi:uncharacterized OB-fold protein